MRSLTEFGVSLARTITAPHNFPPRLCELTKNLTMAKLDTTTVESIQTNLFRLNLPPSQLGAKLSETADAYTLHDLVEGFESLRRSQLRLITSLSDEQVRFSHYDSDFSLSEIISHVCIAQNLTHNLLIDSTSSELPHLDPVPRGAGDGSERGLTSAELSRRLQHATDQLLTVLHLIEHLNSPRLARHPLFGMMTTKGVMLYQIGHDLDHLKQAQTVRRMPGFPAKPASA
jgi:hypothetical protein